MTLCTLAMLAVLAGIPKGSIVIVPASALQGYTASEIKQAQACARSRGVTPKIDRNR